MPKRRSGRGRGGKEDGPQDDSWVQVTADKMAPYFEQWPRREESRSSGSWWGTTWGAWHGREWEREAEDEKQELAPLEHPCWGVVRMTGLLHHRRSGEGGLMATGFEPQRHTWVVQGRPVQAASAPCARCPRACACTALSVSACVLTPDPVAGPAVTQPKAQ